eukprot:gnl/TRDRNA2_/TRDRNA2_188910_c0_seq1.p1 gnl/TRDRNA2_/TRDRNA2_188910_c0~~gnl/TRDRNA2_/TRDRNA2_188910_c0_seq1.p1  ORF type:complete len:526 (-),score=144.33 gnl/TRDRNA2_/TRDRNA2_188910_c0_seq1:161-1738(-)
MSELIELVVQFHPSMRLPFQLNLQDHPFKIAKTAKVLELIDKTERFFEEAADHNGQRLGLQINVLWNVKNANRAVAPNAQVCDHFSSGDIFAVYGDIEPLAAMRSIPEEEKLPVTILTGFLGSGKTTLLNYILEEQKEKKIAIIENEFGEISIDDALLKEKDLKTNKAEQIVVMDNGCMCCTLRGDLVDAFKQILDRIHKGNHLDAIIVETTGMADPVPIVRTFMANQDLTEELRLDGVITMADAKNIIGRLDDKVEEGKVNEAYQQVAFSDKIILNKLDLITPLDAVAVKDRLREINSFAKILPAVKGRVKLSELSDMRAHDMGHFTETAIEKEADEPMLEHGHGGGHGGGHGEGHGSHGGGHEGHGGHGDGHGDGHGCDEDCKEEHGHGAGHKRKDGHGSGHSSGGHGDGHGHAAKKQKRHDSRVNSFSMIREGEIPPHKLSKWMQTLGTLPPEKGTIFRIKGIFAVKDHPYKHVFHAVMDVSDEDDAGPWAPDEKKISKIVFIGKGLDEPFLRQGWEEMFAE